MNKTFKKIPSFRSEAQERAFWQKADSTDYIDYTKAKRANYPNLKLTSRPITIRLPVQLVESAKRKAHRRDIPYQSFLKDILFK